MKHVEATEHGYDGIQVREKGTKFHIRDEAYDARWMKDLDPKAKTATPAAPASEQQPAASPEVAPAEKPAPAKKGARSKKG